jgi:hypothetical protein
VTDPIDMRWLARRLRYEQYDRTLEPGSASVRLRLTLRMSPAEYKQWRAELAAVESKVTRK